jgi:hypothetical protein
MPLGLLVYTAISNSRETSLALEFPGKFSFLATVPSLVFGYLFIGRGVMKYKILTYVRILKNEPDGPDEVPLAV